MNPMISPVKPTSYNIDQITEVSQKKEHISDAFASNLKSTPQKDTPVSRNKQKKSIDTLGSNKNYHYNDITLLKRPNSS